MVNFLFFFSLFSEILTVLFQELIPELYYLPEMFVNSNNVRLVFRFRSSTLVNQPIKCVLLFVPVKIVVRGEFSRICRIVWR